MNKKYLRALQGGVLALGAPFGWLSIEYFNTSDILLELEQNIGLYSYMLFGTEFVFVCFGIYVGSKEDFISNLAIKDGLTGIYNLRFYMERLKDEIANAIRYKEPLSLIYFDLDHFKNINDKFGHPAGDEVLKQVTFSVNRITRTQDIFARVGGEEFVVLLPKCNLKNALIHAEQIRVEIEALEIHIKNKKNIKITVSLGVVEFIQGESLSHFYKRADSNLYQAKNLGRNRLVG